MDEVKLFLLFFPSNDRKFGVHSLNFVKQRWEEKGKAKISPRDYFRRENAHNAVNCTEDLAIWLIKDSKWQ